jgi:hypothetical protein
MLTRRTVTQGAAWTVPVAIVGVGAPAYAASGCVVQTSFDNLTVGQMPGVLTFLPSSVTATIAYSSTGNGGDPTPGDTGEVARTSTTPAWNYIEIEMLSPLVKDDSVTVTITLSEPVSNLGFRIHDIDNDTNDSGGVAWKDRVVVDTPGFGYARGSRLTGIGTSTDPFRNTEFEDQAIDSGLNFVDLTWAGPIQVVSFTYKAGGDGSSGNQHIGLGNISFTDCVAASKSSLPASSTRRSLVAGASGSRRQDGDS